MSSDEGYLGTIDGFRGKRILVIGDTILDVYLKGRTTRLCPEAPVPVVDVSERIATLGGAANTACNLSALGASVILCTVIGDDADGAECLRLLQASGVDSRHVVVMPERQTITKIRVVSGSHVITRIDQGSTNEIDTRTGVILAEHISDAYLDCEALIISDYDKGVVTPQVIESIRQLRTMNNKFTAVDSRRLPFFAALKPSCAKPNYDEALKLLNARPVKDRVTQISEHAGALYEEVQAPLIIATLDEDGSMVIEQGRATTHIDALKTARPSVSGAGDTFLGAFVLSWLACSNAVVSAKIATAAASIAVEKSGTATCSHPELRAFFTIHTKCVSGPEDIQRICARYRAEGKKVVFTNGCFDILHSGHVRYLHKARQMGDVLVVGLNTDDSIRRIKGKGRPINSLADRVHVLAGLSSVTHIIPFGSAEDDTPIAVIRMVRPDIFVKGGDYSKERLPEADTVEALGGRVVLIDHIPDHSTTRIIGKIRSLTPTDSALSEKTP